HHARVDGVERCEELARDRCRLRIDRTHAAEDHRCALDAVHPVVHTREPVVAGDADRQRQRDQRRGHEAAGEEPLAKLGVARHGLAHALVVQEPAPRLAGHGTSTSLPNASRASSRSCARRASASGITESTTGLSAPVAMCFSAAFRSERRPIHDPSSVRWRPNNRSRSSVTLLPIVSPQVTSGPSRAGALTAASKTGPPTCSTTTSTPFLPVSARARAATSSVTWLITSWAPSALARSSFAPVPAVAMTRAPWSRAIWIAALPTPLPAPITSTSSPARTCARVTS